MHVDIHMYMKRVNALELRQALGKVLAQLEADGEPVMVEKGRKPVAVLITLKDFRERFHEKDATDERDRIIEEMSKLAASAPVGDSRDIVTIIREMRGYED